MCDTPPTLRFPYWNTGHEPFYQSLQIHSLYFAYAGFLISNECLFLLSSFPKGKSAVVQPCFFFSSSTYVENFYIPVVDAHLAVVILEFWDPFSAYLSCMSMALPRCDKESFLSSFFFGRLLYKVMMTAGGQGLYYIRVMS